MEIGTFINLLNDCKLDANIILDVAMEIEDNKIIDFTKNISSRLVENLFVNLQQKIINNETFIKYNKNFDEIKKIFNIKCVKPIQTRKPHPPKQKNSVKSLIHESKKKRLNKKEHEVEADCKKIWERNFDKNTNRYYLFNKNTGESIWEDVGLTSVTSDSDVDSHPDSDSDNETARSKNIKIVYKKNPLLNQTQYKHLMVQLHQKR